MMVTSIEVYRIQSYDLIQILMDSFQLTRLRRDLGQDFTAKYVSKVLLINGFHFRYLWKQTSSER